MNVRDTAVYAVSVPLVYVLSTARKGEGWIGPVPLATAMACVIAVGSPAARRAISHLTPEAL